jgi:hypothetical protein
LPDPSWSSPDFPSESYLSEVKPATKYVRPRNPLFTFSGNSLASKAQKFFMNQPGFCADHGKPLPKGRPLPVAMEVQSAIRDRLL